MTVANTTRSRNTLTLAAILLVIATALGAFGEHGLKPKLDANAFSAFQSAVTYHFYHALGLLGLGLLLARMENSLLIWASRLVVAGIVCFSGSLYLLTFGAPKFVGIITPLGGLLLMAAWVLCAIGVRR